MNHEPIYDEKIAPLMAQICEIAKAHDIPFLVSFQLTDQAHEDAKQSGEGPLFCTSCNFPGEHDEALEKAYSILVRPPAPTLLMTVWRGSGKEA